jgi:lipid II:glycine glycyltransferase (peptidoglycan interpeptide bridge formation enzyme)
LEFQAAYTIVESDGTSRTVHRELTHTFDQDCRLTGRRDVYRQHNEPYGIERFVYTYNDAGLLDSQKQKK